MPRGQDTSGHEGRRVDNSDAAARARGFVMARTVKGTGGIKATRAAHDHSEHTQVTQATSWANADEYGAAGVALRTAEVNAGVPRDSSIPLLHHEVQPDDEVIHTHGDWSYAKRKGGPPR